MPKIAVVDTQGNHVKEIDLNPTLFEATVNTDLMAQAIRVRLHNAWLGTRKTKGRGEVRGGGRKPWRQKGTGRARHGSSRSPIWVGGGHVHALLPVQKALALPQKMRRRALFSSLTSKLQQDGIRVLSDFTLDQPKAKAAVEVLNRLGGEKKILLVTSDKNKTLETALKNVPNVNVIEARLLHPYNIFSCDIVILTEDSLSVLENTFVSKE